MLNNRIEKLRAMIEYLTANYWELRATAFLEWIDLYRNILSNNNLM